MLAKGPGSSVTDCLNLKNTPLIWIMASSIIVQSLKKQLLMSAIQL